MEHDFATALMIASGKGHGEVFGKLLGKGASMGVEEEGPPCGHPVSLFLFFHAALYVMDTDYL